MRRNGGRQGAADGPDEIRRALASKALDAGIVVHDVGDVTVLGDGWRTATTGSLPPSPRWSAPVTSPGARRRSRDRVRLLPGLAASGALDGQRLGILNLDAHFDLREASRATSGTPSGRSPTSRPTAARNSHTRSWASASRATPPPSSTPRTP
ncbi:hypothetical protein NKH18_36285 [Streptomyces sp. M10(2022)]